MKRPRGALLLAAGILLLACNFPTLMQAPTPNEFPPRPTSPAAPLIPSVSVTVAPSLTPVPTLTLTPTLRPTPSVPQVTPISVNVNCRSGPDVAYSAVSALLFGQTAQIDGRNEDSSWWYIYDPANAGQFCWVAASVVTTSGNLSGLPIIAPPAAIVTDVTVGVSLPSAVYCGGPNPVEFSGSITTNGDTKVKYQWEVGGDVSHITSPETLTFNSADTKDISGPGSLSLDCGNYTISLHVLTPNDVSATKKFKLQP